MGSPRRVEAFWVVLGSHHGLAPIREELKAWFWGYRGDKSDSLQMDGTRRLRERTPLILGF